MTSASGRAAEERELGDVAPGDRSRDHELLDLLGALEDVVDLSRVVLDLRRLRADRLRPGAELLDTSQLRSALPDL